jgi:acyl dehydratase
MSTPFDIGAVIPEFRRRGTLDAWNRYAAVNYEFAGHHMDDEVGRHEGFASAFAMAPLTFSYVQTMLREWVADSGRIVSVDIRLRSPFLRGRTLIAGGEVTSVQDSPKGRLVHAAVWADDDAGTRLVEGTAVVILDP